MSDKALEDKVAYFKEQGLLDVSDDESGFPDEGLLIAERALADTKAMPPPIPRLVRQRSSFLGPTPKEKQAEFEAYSRKHRAHGRAQDLTLVRSETAPETNTSIEAIVSSSFPSAKPTPKPALEKPGAGTKLRRNMSLPDMSSATHSQDQIPFYKQFGVVPRELKNGKKVNLADKITLLPEPSQLLRGKIICMLTHP